MLKHLSTEEMIALLTPLVRSSKRRKAFLSIPEIAVLDAKAKVAHTALVACQPASLHALPELKEISERGNRLDILHDDLARAVSIGLEAYAAQLRTAEPPAPGVADQCIVAQHLIFPTGLTITSASWLAEAGNAERVSRLIHHDEPWIADLLRSIPASGGRTLYGLTLRWIDSGKGLGEMEQQRDLILAKRAGQKASLKSPQEARNLFFRTVSAILYNLDLSDAPADVIELVRGPIVRASDRAGKRYTSGKVDEPIVEPEELDPEGDESQTPNT